ncbi:MAG: lamin tail domain-containing protein [Pyrinomonadaceae bacterium]
MKFLLLSIFAIALFSLTGVLAIQAKDKGATALVSSTVVINEVYGGAGCGTAGCSTYQNDFIELKNISAGLVNIGGWSVQYAAATGTAWQVTTIPAGTVLRPGDTFLIAESFGANGVNPLPAPNVTGTIAMSATAAKVALVNTNTALTGACPTGNASIVDFASYGATANCAEDPSGTASGSSILLAAAGNSAPAPSTTTSIARNGAGLDTDNNDSDFATGAPSPQQAIFPTAANASIGGRVLSSDGLGISKVTVTLVDGSGTARTSLTNGFGYYSFDSLGTGQTYTLSVRNKRYTFNPSTRVVSLEDNIGDADFTAEP